MRAGLGDLAAGRDAVTGGRASEAQGEGRRRAQERYGRSDGGR
jgi:hypothetical protein